jgi:hypothetical protein
MPIHHQPPRPAVVHKSRTVVRDQRRAPVRVERRIVPRTPIRYARPRVVVTHPIVRPVYVAPVWTASAAYTVQPQPIQLLAPTALSDQLSLSVGALGGATSLELDNAGSGSTYVSQVLLVDASGYTQTLQVNQMLSPQNPTIQLPLTGAVSQIIVQGHSDWGGSLSLRAL